MLAAGFRVEVILQECGRNLALPETACDILATPWGRIRSREIRRCAQGCVRQLAAPASEVWTLMES